MESKEKENKIRRAIYVQQRLKNIKNKRREINKIAYELFLNPATIYRDAKVKVE